MSFFKAPWRSSVFTNGSWASALLALLLFPLAVLGTFGAVAKAGTLVEIGSGVLDRDRIEGPRWKRLDFSPPASGAHSVRVTWNADADVRFSLFDAATGERLATTHGSPGTDEWIGTLDGSGRYAVSVWAASGRSAYTITVGSLEAPGSAIVSASGARSFSTGTVWNAGGQVHRVLTVGSTLFVGGDFTDVYSPEGDVLSRTYLAAFNRFTGEPTGFSPVLDGEVRALALSPDENTLYVGGAFRTAEGVSRERVAAFDVRTGALTRFNPPAPNRPLRTITVTRETVYLGGLFTYVGDVERPYVAAFDPRTSALDTRFSAWPSGKVMSMIVGAEGLWIGGDFARINGAEQRGLGLLDTADGSLQATDEVTADVIDLAASDTQVFAAVGGPGGRAVAIDRLTGAEQWTIASDGDFQGVAVGEGRFVYFGGHYETVEGNKDADRFTRHDKRTGKMDTTWLPSTNGYRSVNVLDVRPDGLYIGGDFTWVNKKPQAGFAILPGSTE